MFKGNGPDLRKYLGEGAPGLTGAHIYRDTRVESDLAVHLHYELGGTRGPRDGMGDRLAAALNEYGLVDRALWVKASGSRDEGEASR